MVKSFYYPPPSPPFCHSGCDQIFFLRYGAYKVWKLKLLMRPIQIRCLFPFLECLLPKITVQLTALGKGLTTIRRLFCRLSSGSAHVHYLGCQAMIIGVLDLSMTVI